MCQEDLRIRKQKMLPGTQKILSGTEQVNEMTQKPSCSYWKTVAMDTLLGNPLRSYLLGPHIYVSIVNSRRLPECVGQRDPFGFGLSKAVQEQRESRVMDKAHG